MDTAPIPIEFHQIELRYRHTRVLEEAGIRQLARSMAACGQLRPVCVSAPEPGRYVLIDGYWRVEAGRRLGWDTVLAGVTACDEPRALAHVLLNDHQRRLRSIEQAWLLQELSVRFGRSVRQIAQLVGRDGSWVQRRLDLVRCLPEAVAQAVAQGRLSTWAACRVLAPLARANARHADKLCDYLRNHHVATRPLEAFFNHYKKSSHAVRQNLVEQPELFFKAVEQRTERLQDRQLRRGPEGGLLDELNTVARILQALVARLPELLDPLKTTAFQNRFRQRLSAAKLALDLLHERLCP